MYSATLGSLFFPFFCNASRTSFSRPVQAMPKDFRVSITNPPGKEAYPIASFTWLLIPEEIADPEKGKAIVGFLNWMLSEGQHLAPALKYAPLPPEVVKMETTAIGQIQY